MRQLFYEPREDRLYSELVVPGREDIAVMNRLSDSEIQFYTSTICFHAQQSVEKYL